MILAASKRARHMACMVSGSVPMVVVIEFLGVTLVLLRHRELIGYRQGPGPNDLDLARQTMAGQGRRRPRDPRCCRADRAPAHRHPADPGTDRRVCARPPAGA